MKPTLSLYVIGILTIFSTVTSFKDPSECLPKTYGYSSIVCVCNDAHCDDLNPIRTPNQLTAVVVTSSKSGKRWKESPSSIPLESGNYRTDDRNEADVVIQINITRKFQKIFGFGGAFTDATGINLRTLSENLQATIIKGYYGGKGLEYNLGRVPIGGTDFSTHPYSYDDLPPGQSDEKLKFFSLQMEDHLYKIPYIKKAQHICEERSVDLKLYASPWSSPGWMKTNGKINGKGKLLKKYYSTWASYILRFIDNYAKNEIHFTAITAQNEPTTGLFYKYPFNTIGWTPEEQGDWIANYLGPTLKKSGKNITIIIGDDQRFLFPVWVEKVMSVPGVQEYVGGVGVHWYFDAFTPLLYLDLTHKYFPSLPILYTEACSGSMPWDLERVMLGSWERAEDYMEDILEDLEHWVVGWTDWNLALDTQGGPNWVQNFVDSPIIVNKTAGEIYRQPTFYALAHISKILPEGSQRILSHVSGSQVNLIRSTTFERPDGTKATILLNRYSKPITVEIRVAEKSFRIAIEERSFASIIWSL